MSAGRFDGQTAFRPGAGRPKGFDQQVQDIASAAHLRGIVLMKGETVVGSVEAADLCKALRAAHENTRGQDGRHGHVLTLANGIAARLGAKGAVQVSNFAWTLIRGYANARKVKGESAEQSERSGGRQGLQRPESPRGSDDAPKVRAS